MDKIEPYDYLKNSLMSEEDIEKMVELNPYKRYISYFFFDKTPVLEHKRFNQLYSLGYGAGAMSKLLEMAKLLREKGMEKEELRVMISQVIGRELLKSDDNG